jgi:molybdate transport system substrate-binding protein
MTGMRGTVTGLLFGMLVWTLAASGSIPHQEGGANASPSAAGVELAIAAPDELNSALTELARKFEQKTGKHIHFTFTDSANLLTQIQNGSAFDAVFLLDMNDVRRLAASGTVAGNSITEYARDPMVLCIAPWVRIEPRPGNPLLLLTAKNIPHIAIASPQHTVFGKVTVQALTAIHIYDFELRRKLLVGEDVAQVAQFLEKGSADVALLPGSALNAHHLGSTRVLPIPSKKLYSPIQMGAGVLRQSKHSRQALEFLRFAVSSDGKAIFRDAGFDEPQRTAARKR